MSLVCLEPHQRNPIHHLQVGFLGDRWFLIHIIEKDYVILVPYFKFIVFRINLNLNIDRLSSYYYFGLSTIVVRPFNYKCKMKPIIN